MSCYSCTENFGVFRREHSCKRCHLSFCSKCLPHKAVLHSSGSKAQPVCRSCYKILTTVPKPDEQNTANHARYSPPENFKRRMEALAAKEEPKNNQPAPLPASSSKGNAKSNQFRGLEPKDRNLVERLNKLKEDRKKQQGTIPSTEEMEERLRVLRGLSKPSDNPSVSQASKPYFPRDNRNMEEQFQDLMDEMSAEVELEGRSEKKNGNFETNPAGTSSSEGNLLGNGKGFHNDVKNLNKEGEGKVADNDKDLQEDVKRLLKESEQELKRAKQQEDEDSNLAAKLASIQGLDPEKAQMDFKSKGVFHDTSSDEEEELATKRLLQQLAEEERLNEKVKASGNEDILNQAEQSIKKKEATKGYVVDPDELPWCCICNEDAVLRCLECEGDLYCKRCFKEGHDEFGETHKTERYKPPKNRDK